MSPSPSPSACASASPAKIVVFDIDGTLTQSSGVDDASFQRAARDLLGLAEISLDWSSYPHSTDDAIAAHLVARAQGRPASRAEIDAFERGFIGVLDGELARAGGLRAVPGAERVFDRVRAQGWVPAVATGCWRRSALRKLQAAGIDVRGIGAAFADDSWPREGIIALAAARALAIAGGCADGEAGANASAVADSSTHCGTRVPPNLVTYLGDGIWDVRACVAGGYRFVGIAQGQRAEALRQEGAGTVLANYADEGAFLDAIRNAQVPRKS